MVLDYVGEMLRVLRPGGLLFFQVPVGDMSPAPAGQAPPVIGPAPDPGLPAEVLYRRLGLNPVRMISVTPSGSSAA